MKLTTKISSLLLICLPALAGNNNVIPAASLELNDLLMESLQQVNNVPGMAAAIYKDGQLIWHKEVGYADYENKIPVTEKTKFRFASASKFITSAILVKMVENNKIDIQKEINYYLPEYPTKKSSFNSIQLASHTSGMAHYQEGFDENKDLRTDVYQSSVEATEVYKNRPLKLTTGSAYNYSSYGTNLLSAVMEKAANKKYPLMLKELARRTRASSLETESLDAEQTNWSKLYDTKGNEYPRNNITYKWASGGVLGSAIDLAKVGKSLLDSNYVSEETLNLFTTPVKLNNGDTAKGKRYAMGLGFRMSKDHNGRSYFHHSGVMTGARSHISVYPEENLVIAFLSNARWTSAMDFNAEVLANSVLNNLQDSIQSNKAISYCDETPYAYSGIFGKNKSVITGKLVFKQDNLQCKGVLTADNKMGKWLGDVENQEYPIFLNGSELSLVTPMGLYIGVKRRDSLSIMFTTAKVKLTLTKATVISRLAHFNPRF